MDSDAGRLVECDHGIVFVKDRDCGPGDSRQAAMLVPAGGANGRDAQLVAHRKTRVRLGPLSVEADLPTAQDTVDMALGNALEHAQQEVVDALSSARLVDRKAVDSVLA